MRRLVRSVMQNATVTASHASVSLRLDPILMNALDVRPFEDVEVVNAATGERFATWVEAGAHGEVSLRHVRTGDAITVISHGFLHDGQTLAHKVRSVAVDANNQLISISEA